METIGKIVRGLAAIPVIGGALVFVLGFLPVLLTIPLNLSNGISMIIGGLLMAAWCYFLNVKKIINIVTPLIPIPLWILGIVMALAGVYGIVTNKWDDSDAAPEAVKESIQPSDEVESRSVPSQKQTESESEVRSETPSNSKQEAEQALVQMEQALEGMKNLANSIGEKQLEEMMNAHGDAGNKMTLKEAMAKMQKQIDELKSQGYGSGETE